MKRVCLMIGLSLGLSSLAWGDDPLKGVIAMAGSILETPCAIGMTSVDQTIELDTVPLSTLKQWGEGPRHPFFIQIIDCRLRSSDGTIWRHFSMTFDGVAEREGFSVFGTASGIALRVDDVLGHAVTPGQPLSAGALWAGDRRLEYGLRVVSNHQAYTPGAFQSTIRFKLDYY